MARTSARAGNEETQGAGAAMQPATEATKEARDSGGNAEVTRLDDFNDAPSVTAPGDGPADTTDPTERASTVGGDKAAAAREGHLTVNAAIPMKTDDRGRLVGTAISYATGQENGDANGERVEKYPLTRPNGETVTVEHNLDTGVTRIV